MQNPRSPTNSTYESLMCLGWPINPTSCKSLDCGRKQEYQREHAPSTQKGPKLDLNPQHKLKKKKVYDKTWIMGNQNCPKTNKYIHFKTHTNTILFLIKIINVKFVMRKKRFIPWHTYNNSFFISLVRHKNMQMQRCRNKQQGQI